MFVIDGKEAFKRDVVMGTAGVMYQEIVEGLSEGQQVILSNMKDHMHLDRIKIK